MNKVHFVCSRGLLQSCTFHSSNPTSSCATDVGYLDKVLIEAKPGDSVYVCSEALPYFVTTILPSLQVPIVLVTGDSDLTMTDLSILDNPRIIRWFCQNCPSPSNSKLVQLPIGLDYHTIMGSPTHKWTLPGEGTSPAAQEGLLRSLPLRPFYERSPKIYVNFGWISRDRRDALNAIPKSLMTLDLVAKPRSDVWTAMTQHAFVLSPYGNGLDCHRTWEALALSAIPIIKGRHFDAMFEGLPVLIVDSWTEVTQNLLQDTIDSFRGRRFDLHKLSLRYWQNLIRPDMD